MELFAEKGNDFPRLIISAKGSILYTSLGSEQTAGETGHFRKFASENRMYRVNCIFHGLLQQPS